jgi:GTP-binding protein
MADYLDVRRSLAGVVLMVDSRLGFTDLDRQLLDFVAPRLANGSVKLLVLLTKADKLNRRDADRSLQQVSDTLAALGTEASDIGVALFSALSKRGVDDTAVLLRAWVDSLRAPVAAIA